MEYIKKIIVRNKYVLILRMPTVVMLAKTQTSKNKQQKGGTIDEKHKAIGRMYDHRFHAFDYPSKYSSSVAKRSI